MRWAQAGKPIRIMVQILAIALQLAACTANMGYREQLSRNECTAGISSKDFPLRVKWCLKLDSLIESSPKIKDGIVYIQTRSNLPKSVFYAIDAKTSTILWRYETEAGMGNQSFLWDVVGDYMIIGGPHQWGSLIEALDRHTGQRIWQKQIGYIMEAIVTGDNRLYVATQASLYQLDPSNGDILWEFPGLPSHTSFRAFYNPVNKTVIVPADHYYVVDAQSGALVYKGDYVYSRKSAVIYEGSLVYGGEVVHAVDGSLRFGLPGGDDYVLPVVISNTVYYVANVGHYIHMRQLISSNLETWDENWGYAPEAPLKYSSGRIFISDPVSLGNAIYIFTQDDKVRAISLDTGHEIGQWYGPQSGETLSPQDGAYFVPPPPSMAVSDKSLYISFGTNLLYGFETR